MDKGFKHTVVNDFKELNTKKIECESNYLYKLALASILTNKIENAENVFKSIEDDLEKMENYLELGNAYNSACYHFGRISSITNLVLDLSREKSEARSLNNITKSYPLLLPTLKIIKKYNTISGVKLQREMNFKTSSGLSNFLRRIKKYNLVNVTKLGRTNYISLTNKGKKLLDEN